MLTAIREESNVTRTENGALTYRSSGSACLDLFAAIGALRTADAEEIGRRFQRAYSESPELAMKILFFARDVRGGLGERRVFRVIYEYLLRKGVESGVKNLKHIAEYGRYDDLISLMALDKAHVLPLIRTQLSDDMKNLAAGQPVSLLAKWMPSVNTSSKSARHLALKVARALGMNNAEYRKTLSSLRRRIGVIENYLREKDYSFDYSCQPSNAMLKYRAAFMRNDGKRYLAFLDSVSRSEAVLKTGALYPYEIIEPIISERYSADTELKSLEVSWQSLPDFTRGENSIVVADGSGSMHCGKPMAISIALSLALYFAERNTGAFQGRFITFSETPRLVKVTGNNLRDKALHALSYDECANTNVAAVFQLILKSAVKHKVPASELPKRIYIISDMEFDNCAGDADVTNFEAAKAAFAEHGYELPQVVFWNVDSRNEQQPVKENEQGVILVSGRSPKIFSLAMEDYIDPYKFMADVLSSDRYLPICA